MHINSILLVDDDQNIRAISEKTLEPEFDVYLAGSGTDCIVAAEAEQPDLILFDVKTPIVNGLTTLIMLRQNPRTVAIPVILMTANLRTWAQWHADELIHRRFQKLDIIGFTERSFDRITLPAQIRRLARDHDHNA